MLLKWFLPDVGRMMKVSKRISRSVFSAGVAEHRRERLADGSFGFWLCVCVCVLQFCDEVGFKADINEVKRRLGGVAPKTWEEFVRSDMTMGAKSK